MKKTSEKNNEQIHQIPKSRIQHQVSEIWSL